MEKGAATCGKYRRGKSKLDSRWMTAWQGVRGGETFFLFIIIYPLSSPTPLKTLRSPAVKDVRPQRLKERRTLLFWKWERRGLGGAGARRFLGGRALMS